VADLYALTGRRSHARGRIMPAASAGVLFAMDMTSPPNYGFDTRTVPSEVTYTNAASAGPDGGNALRITHQIQVSHNQYTHGLSTDAVEAEPAIGATRYHRIYYKFIGTQNYTCNSPQGAWENKFIIFGVGGAESTGGRVILYHKATPRWEWSKNIDVNGPDVAIPTDGAWHALQIMVRSSSVLSAADAVLSIWHDNDTEGSPTSSVSGDAISTSAWGSAGFGSFADATLATGGNIDYYIGGYEYASAFDASWYANMAS